MRYGYARGLTFAIPVKNWMYSFNEFFTASQVTTYTWNPQNTFDMMVFLLETSTQGIRANLLILVSLGIS